MLNPLLMWSHLSHIGDQWWGGPDTSILQQEPLRLGEIKQFSQDYAASKTLHAYPCLCDFKKNLPPLCSMNRGGNLLLAHHIPSPEVALLSWNPLFPENLVNSFNEPNKCALWSVWLITPWLPTNQAQVCRAPGTASLIWIIATISPPFRSCTCRGAAARDLWALRIRLLVWPEISP